MTYRPDIDGLRAIAVLAVVIFHLGVPGFDGGYVGVDVFFVISGFLITSIIKGKLEAGDFSLSGFYSRRIRRLVPPLLVTVAVTVVGAGLLLTPYDMIRFARSAVAAIFSLSNIVFFLEAGYWDTASELKPLLHTWSLGVEEQFYLFWPALLMLIMAVRERISFTAAMVAITVVGFILCVWYTTVSQSAAFYLLPFRVFQFSMGALVIPLGDALAAGLQGRSRLPSLLLLAGLSLIVLSVATLGDTVFPGWVVIIPTAGAALCLLAGAVDTSKASAGLFRLLDNPLSLWVGRVSYSMYLVHWPIVALYRYEFGLELRPDDQILLAAATLLATCVLHYGVERQFYRRSGYQTGGAPMLGNRAALVGIGFSAITIAGVSCTAWLGDGWLWRTPQLRLTSEDIRAGQAARLEAWKQACTVDRLAEGDDCSIGDRSIVLVVGNSHEPDGYNFVRAILADQNDVALVNFGNFNDCGEVILSAHGPASENELCQSRLEALTHPALLDRVVSVVYSANKPFRDNKQIALEILNAVKSQRPATAVITLSGYISTKRWCSFYINRSTRTEACAYPENVDYFGADPRVKPYYGRVMALTSHFVDKVDLLCKNRVLETCATATPEGIPAFYDKHHLSLEFAQMAGRRYRERHPEIVDLLTGR